MFFTLRPWKEDDAFDLADFADNPKIAQNLRDAFCNPYTLEDARSYIKSCIENEGGTQICRAIEIDGRAAGSIGVFCGSDVYRKSAETGYWLAEDYWRKGVMSAALKQLCTEAFSRFDIVRIFAEPYADNLGSRGVLEKAGFALEDVMKNSVYKNGVFHDSCMYARLK